MGIGFDDEPSGACNFLERQADTLLLASFYFHDLRVQRYHTTNTLRYSYSITHTSYSSRPNDARFPTTILPLQIPRHSHLILPSPPSLPSFSPSKPSVLFPKALSQAHPSQWYKLTQ